MSLRYSIILRYEENVVLTLHTHPGLIADASSWGGGGSVISGGISSEIASRRLISAVIGNASQPFARDTWRRALRKLGYYSQVQ